MATPDYKLESDFTYFHGQDSKTLPAGSFVRPIELKWVPKHITDDPASWKHGDKEDVYCYCNHGIISIPRRLIRIA